jgi:peroxiredoxin
MAPIHCAHLSGQISGGTIMNVLARLCLPAGLVALMLVFAGAQSGADDGNGDEKKDKTARINEPAPDFTLTDSKGVEHTISSYKGRIIVLEWTNPECRYVQRHYSSKSMLRTHEAVKKLDADLVWLAIDSTATVLPEHLNFWIKQHKIPYPHLLDKEGDVARLYEARVTPQMFVIDREGVLRYRGAIDDNSLGYKLPDDVTNYVIDAVSMLVEGKSVTPNQTKPYGCHIKAKPKKGL